MKTLAQLKRDLNIGDKVKVLEVWERRKGENVKIDLPEKMQEVREVSYKDTTGWYFKRKDDTSRGSFCDYPKASELVYTDDTFSIDDKYGTRIYKIIR